MKKTMKELELGFREEIDLFVKEFEESTTRNGKTYVIFTVYDRNKEEFKVKKWDASMLAFSNVKEKVVTMNVKASTYMGEVTFDTDSLTLSDAPISDFIKTVGDVDKMIKEILIRVDDFKDSELKNLIHLIFEDYKDKLNHWAAAKSHHHALYGGLVYHIYRMGKNADAMCDVYHSLNRELLVASAYLHDIGKLKELNTNKLGVAEYTTEGSLFGHHYLGMQMIEEYAKKVNLSEKTLIHLKHMIASHHGKQEWGAIVEPKTMEAQMLHYLDMIDSRIVVFEDCYQSMESDTFAKTLNGQIYKF